MVNNQDSRITSKELMTRKKAAWRFKIPIKTNWIKIKAIVISYERSKK